MDELLAGEAERPERQTGDDIFESDPKGLLGSLLKIKEKAAVDGVGRYATIRIHQGHCQAAQGGAELKVSLAGDGSATNIVWIAERAGHMVERAFGSPPTIPPNWRGVFLTSFRAL